MIQLEQKQHGEFVGGMLGVVVVMVVDMIGDDDTAVGTKDIASGLRFGGVG